MSKYNFFRYTLYGKVEPIPQTEAIDKLREGQPVFTVKETGEVFYPRSLEDLIKEQTK